MKLLLDTHAFLWWDSDATRLPSALLRLLLDPANEIILSVVAVWEMRIKADLGKLRLRLPLATIVREQRTVNGVSVLPIELHHVLLLEAIAPHHRDPFDRLLIAQAKADALTIVSKDEAFRRYDLDVRWE